MFMVMLSAFNLLLSRYSSSVDVVIGAPIAGRNRAETHDLVGYFVNVLAIRTDLSDAASFVDLVRRVKLGCVESYSHADVAFQEVVDALRVRRDTSYTPLFQVMFTLLDEDGIAGPTRLAGGPRLVDDV
eukprot:SAG11_NODE_23588_length_386_cov_0.665505_1_plen_128_part_11